ncbi:hypothetical protein M2158_007142 [Streptomyces sp. SAI-144]|uniref:hypothetical protein n=1 Tax=unclassified Streptomyces TaxID=2593676 RepID=UPI002474B52E|nr:MULTISPECIES: hypothetical protein [unclassified Streptomyces]MDH6438601.1 hypothetical protein [Streptomyces sp. SAI-144]MDH6486000.1 hypothetical protein [Streptomyces sp. SAI-127]
MNDLLAVSLDGGVAEVWRECADVLYGTRPLPVAAALRLSTLTLCRYPGAVLVLVPRLGGGFLALARDAPGQAATPAGPEPGLSQGHAGASPAGPGPCR